MEELFLCHFLTREELDIVNKKHVAGAILFLEGGGRAVSYRTDKLLKEGFALFINNVYTGVSLLHVVDDRIEKVGLTESRVTVDEQGIVSVGLLRYRVAGSLCKLVRRALYKVVEGVVVEKRSFICRRADALGNDLFFLLVLILLLV